MGAGTEDTEDRYQSEVSESYPDKNTQPGRSSTVTWGENDYHDHTPLRSEARGSASNGDSYNDVIFAVLFIMTLIGVAVFGVSQANGDLPPDNERRLKFKIDKEDATLYGIVCVIAIPVAMLSGTVQFFLMRTRPIPFIYMNLIGFNILLWISTILLVIAKAWLAVVIMAISALIHLWWVFAVKRRIAFTAAFYQMIMTALKRYPATFAVVYLILFIQIAAFGGFMYVGARFMQIHNKNGQDGALTAGFIFLVFSLFWTFEVLQNIVHVTVSGTIGAWYFQGDSAPPNATTRAFGRAVTKSFGSICFGSLIVAIVQTLRFIVNHMKQAARDDRNGAMLFVACCLDCLLSCLEWMVRYFNRYAFVQVALYGKNFLTAAKDTYALMQERGLDMIINDEISGQVLMVSALLTALECAVVTAIVLWAMGKDVIAAAILVFVLVFIIMTVTYNVVTSSMAAVYVCYAEEPEHLHRNHEELAPHFQHARQEAYEDGY